MKNILSLIKIIALIVIVLFLYGSAAKLFHLPQIPIFKSTEVRYDSPVIIEKIKAVFDLYTQEYYSEVFEDSGMVEKDKRLVFIAKGKIIAGVDIDKAEIVNLDYDKKSISIKLPAPFTWEIKTNPDDFEYVRVKGKWTEEEITSYKDKAREKLFKLAVEKGTFDRSSDYSKQLIESLLKSLRFENITIDIIKNKEILDMEEEIKKEGQGTRTHTQAPQQVVDTTSEASSDQ